MFSKIYHHTFIDTFLYMFNDNKVIIIIIKLILLRLNEISVILQYDQSDPGVIHVHCTCILMSC